MPSIRLILQVLQMSLFLQAYDRELPHFPFLELFFTSW